jgi:hypothetical protein
MLRLVLKNRKRLPKKGVLVLGLEKEVQSSLLAEVPVSLHRNLLPFLGASLPPERSENTAREAKEAFGDAAMVKLRGKVSFACVPLANVTFAPYPRIAIFGSSFFIFAPVFSVYLLP